ncbi:hypothetical protein H0H93_010877 [Arthromyces matolae]|nr:hypothetical protein H0H93_010877 [Arthromyces matolae]
MQELEAVRIRIRVLQQEVDRLGKEDSTKSKVKRDLGRARAAVTRNQNKAERLQEALKMVANEAPAQAVQDPSESLSKKRGIDSVAVAKTLEHQPKRKAKYSDLDRSSSLTPVPDELTTNPQDDADNAMDKTADDDAHKDGDEEIDGGNTNDNVKEKKNQDVDDNAKDSAKNVGADGGVMIKGPANDKKDDSGIDAVGSMGPLVVATQSATELPSSMTNETFVESKQLEDVAIAGTVAKPVIEQKEKGKAKKGSGTDHYPILSKGYGQLSDEDKEEFIRAGRAVFRAFCNSSAEEKKVYEFPASLGTAVRMHAEVLPESASISRELAIAMLTSTFENKQCIHHMMNRKQSKEAQEFYITGVEALMSGNGTSKAK